MWRHDRRRLGNGRLCRLCRDPRTVDVDQVAMTGSELADALSASRSRAIAALGKAYVLRAEDPDPDFFRALMHGMGLDDDFAITFLMHAWDVLREQREQPPGEQVPAEPKEDFATKALLDYLDSLLKEEGLPQRDPEYQFTKPEASKAIEEVKAGTYDPKRYELPF